MQQREYEDLQDASEGLPFEDFTHMQVAEITPSKSNCTLLAGRIADQVKEGHVNPIDAAIRLNAVILMAEEALVMIKPDVIDEVERSSGKVEKQGCKVEKFEAGTKYDYSANGNWREFAATEKEAAAERKKVEEVLKKIPAGKLQVDESTGETLQGPSKTSTTAFKVTLAR